MRRVLTLAATLALAVLPAGAALAHDRDRGGHPEFTHGVASGDVTPTSAVLWTRVDREADLVAEVSLEVGRHRVRWARARAEADERGGFTAKAEVRGLLPGATYTYRWRSGGAVSETGTFRTAPAPWRRAGLRLAWSGDSDGTRVLGVPAFNEFEALDAVRQEDPDAFGYLGDTIYSDSGARPAPATTLDEYRSMYAENRDYPALRELLRATSTYAQWDDHEVVNDYDGQTVDPARYATGIRAFGEWMPTRGEGLEDPSCAGDPAYRTVRWGRDVELFLLDERSCRSADVAPACLLTPTQADLLPGAPTPIRQGLRLRLPAAYQGLVPDAPPPGCAAALDDPARTMLGPVQKQAFLRDLERSTARYKLVLGQVAMQQQYSLPYDRWEGYAAERREVLEFVRDRVEGRVVFLTTDQHQTLMNEVYVGFNPLAGPLNAPPVAYEAVVGPIATNTQQAEIVELFGPDLGPLAVGAVRQIYGLFGVDCASLDTDGYGLVDVAPGGGLHLASKDETRAVIRDDVSGAACEVTLT